MGKIISRASRDPGKFLLQTVPTASLALWLTRVFSPLSLGQVGQSRSLPVSWRTEEAPLLWGRWYFLAPCADTQEWGCRLFVYCMWAQTLWTLESECVQLCTDTFLIMGRYTERWIWLERTCR